LFFALFHGKIFLKISNSGEKTGIRKETGIRRDYAEITMTDLFFSIDLVERSPAMAENSGISLERGKALDQSVV